MKWPILYKNVLKVKDIQSPVGVAVMWTERNVVANLLKDSDYCVIGNLYSAAGISAVIRNIYAKPSIRYLILWGADLSRSGQSFIQFMEKGVDAHNFIIGDEKRGQIEKDIPIKDINRFRKSIKLLNMRGASPIDLKKAVENYSKKSAKPFSEPKLFASKKSKPFTFPSEQIGFRASGKTVALTWLRLLNIILRYGRIKETRYAKENELKEVLNMIAIITDENSTTPYMPHYFPFTQKDLDVYYPQVLSAKKIPGVSYTYGQRLRNNETIDQVKEVIDLIKRRPFSKKMIMSTVNISRDWGRDNVDRGDTPCLTNILCSIQDNKLFMTAHFRSQDMVHGWPRNAFSLIKLQQLIADETDYSRGSLCIISHSAHIYSDDFAFVKKTLEDNFEKELPFTPAQHFEEDPRGNFTIEVVNRKKLNKNKDKASYAVGSGEIVLTLFSPSGGLALKSWKGKRAMDVYLQLTDEDYFSMPSHAIDIGAQLQRAEYAIKFGWEYSQDMGPNKL